MSMRGVRSRRRYRRRTIRVQIAYELDRVLHKAVATTLGAGGMFVATEHPPAEGTEFCVRFRLPSGEHEHEIHARVVWANGPEDLQGHTRGMGIEFDDTRACAILAAELEQDDGPRAGGESEPGDDPAEDG